MNLERFLFDLLHQGIETLVLKANGTGQLRRSTAGGNHIVGRAEGRSLRWQRG
jgi:hypothetical protein